MLLKTLIAFPPLDVNAKRTFFCYSHTLKYADGSRLMFAGCCPAADILKCPDARLNTEWNKYCSDRTDIEITIFAIADSFQEATIAVRDFLTMHPTHCNANGKTIRNVGQRTKVLNVTTGVEYPNAAAACRAFGIAPATMSSHLNNRPGYKSIHSMVFRRVY